MLTESDWIDFVSFAVGAEHMTALYTDVTKLERPKTFQALGEDALRDPSPTVLTYLQWVTVSQWGQQGVPPEFWEEARARWPKVRLPTPPID